VAGTSLTLGLPASVKQNDQFTVQVDAAAQSLNNATFVLTYDPKVLELVGRAEGTLLKQRGAKTNFQSFADVKKGELWVSVSRVGSTMGVSGKGSLTTVTFKAIGKGATGMGFTRINFTTKDGEPITVTAFKSVVEVK
jgi:general secretion pathway protein D